MTMRVRSALRRSGLQAAAASELLSVVRWSVRWWSVRWSVRWWTVR